MEKTEKINFRLSERLKNRASVRAAELGMKLSEYIRYLITKDIEEK